MHNSVLFVDDVGPVAKAAERALRAEGLMVRIATTAELAVDCAQTDVFDVVVTDYRLGGDDGLSLLGRLQILQPQAVFVLLSAALELDVVLQAVNRYGVRFILHKPFHNSTLIGLVRQALSIAAENQHASQQLAELQAQYEEQRHWAGHLEAVLSTQQEQFIGALLDVLAAKDQGLFAHGRRVARYGQAIGRAVGLRASAQRDMVEAALVHDLCVIGLPDTVLLKPGPLSPHELQLIRSHIQVGDRLLSELDGKEGAKEVFVQHHERWDGSGYPNGLRGNDICLGARVFAVADAFDAMTAKRPYRDDMPAEEAILELQRCAGSQFDPDVVAGLTELGCKALFHETWELAACAPSR